MEPIARRPDLHIDQVVTDGDAEKDAVAEQFGGVATISGLQSGNEDRREA